MGRFGGSAICKVRPHPRRVPTPPSRNLTGGIRLDVKTSSLGCGGTRVPSSAFLPLAQMLTFVPSLLVMSPNLCYTFEAGDLSCSPHQRFDLILQGIPTVVGRSGADDVAIAQATRWVTLRGLAEPGGEEQPWGYPTKHRGAGSRQTQTAHFWPKRMPNPRNLS